MFIITNPVLVEAALNLLGMNVGAPWLLLVEATAEEKEKLSQLLRDVGLP